MSNIITILDKDTEIMKLMCFDSNNLPGHLYLTAKVHYFNYKEITELRDFLNSWLGTTVSTDNLNKSLIKALGEKNGN
jgi:hypothetical protein